MNKFKSIFNMIILLFFIQGCSEILEPVLLKGSLVNDTIKEQEEFKVNIDTLNFHNVKQANKDPYLRKIMVNGSGSKANVFNEVDFLFNSIPEPLKMNDYKMSMGDILSFHLMHSYKNEKVQWPTDNAITDYVLGVGDELHFIQKTSSDINTISIARETRALSSNQEKTNNIVSIDGVIGSDENILLLGIGNIRAAGRKLKDIRSEIRNILIRNGSETNFQLEIKSFNSQKAYVSSKIKDMNSAEAVKEVDVLPITNVSISLREVALSSGLSVKSKNRAIIILTRNKKNYRFTAEQFFDENSPRIQIKDKDEIAIELSSGPIVNNNITIGTKGYVLLPGIGKLIAANRTLEQLRTEVKNILIKDGFEENFQLELKKPNNKKIYVILRNQKSVIKILSQNASTLKDVVLGSSDENGSVHDKSLVVITLKRGKKIYRLTMDKILDMSTPKILLQKDDQIEIDYFKYKPGQVFALNGAGYASIINIDPSKRETLADILFVSNGAFSNLLAKRSEVYLLRGRNPSVAYHLDTQNVSRILIAAKTELRPNDIIYIADRPIISFGRLLSELTPLRILLRDIDSGNIP